MCKAGRAGPLEQETDAGRGMEMDEDEEEDDDKDEGTVEEQEEEGGGCMPAMGFVEGGGGPMGGRAGLKG